MTKEQAEKEIHEMVETYRREFGDNYQGGFFLGSSICGNKKGDSARYWELREVLNK